MDEYTAVLRARAFVSKVNRGTIPASIEAYTEHVGAVLRLEADLGLDEPGYSVEINGKHYICVNGNDSPERRRFTACHEIAHIVLGLPSDHGSAPWWSYAKRSPDEICCDVFAAELLLPHQLFEPLVERADIGFGTIDDLSGRFIASNTATGSRYAMVITAPAAFVLSERGAVRYASRSKALREATAWISPHASLPSGSLSARVRAGKSSDETEEVAADLWFTDWDRGGLLREEARHLRQWDQTLTLLWFADEEVPPPMRKGREEPENQDLEGLDGTLPWPGKSRRRR
jgi:hypothetical protein